MTPQLQALLDSLPDSDRVEWVNLVSAVYTARYTGISIIHWKNGVPKQIDLGQPIRLSIVSGLDTPHGSRSE